ncbi:hypothetical protein DPMN_074804 [Dreissena polymorpha]|uniref:Uncharacterized protein n=1 Tax=Dreissena polymorpha TaxID=45954 RepID=A0A9D4BNS1_DREPO|nr:hypothetical protein DPMN_074804 [Dreissena polymorpha]
MPKDYKCEGLEDVRTNESNINMVVQLVFDILSGRLWTSQFITNSHYIGQKVITPMEDVSSNQHYVSINNTCTVETTIAEQPTISINDEEEDTIPSGQDYSDSTAQKRDLELHEETVLRPNINNHSETIYERRIQYKLEKAVDVMDQR